MSKGTREKIIDKASKLFWGKSYTAVSVDQICKESGVQKGSFYHYFPSKENLAIKIIDEVWEQYEDHILKPTFDDSIPPLKRFNRLAKVLSDTACKIHETEGQFKGCPFGNLAVELSTQNDTIRKKVESTFNKYTRYFIIALDEAKESGELDQSIDSEALAEIIFSFIQGSFVTAKAKNQPQDLEAQFNSVLSNIFVPEKLAVAA